MVEMETHKYQDSIGVRFPVLYYLLILFGRHFQVHGKKWPEPSAKLDTPCDFWFCAVEVGAVVGNGRHLLGRTEQIRTYSV